MTEIKLQQCHSKCEI